MRNLRGSGGSAGFNWGFKWEFDWGFACTQHYSMNNPVITDWFTEYNLVVCNLVDYRIEIQDWSTDWFTSDLQIDLQSVMQQITGCNQAHCRVELQK